MQSLSAAASLRQPVRLHGIHLGWPTDLFIDVEAWQAVGYIVRCGDESMRFLPWIACQTLEGEIAVGSALMLLEDIDFYAKRSASFRSLVGGEVALGGVLRDLLLDGGGKVSELEIERDERLHRVAPAGIRVSAAKATAA